MKFGKHLQNQILPEILADPKYKCFQASMIRYQILKNMIRKIDFDTSDARGKEELSGECCICFETFEFRSDAISTRCGHFFHPCCLINAFSVEGSRGNCPLCRFPVAELVPKGFDGDVLRFLAMVRVNMDAADNCHERFVRHLRSCINELLEAAKVPHFGPIRRFFAGWRCDARLQHLTDEAMLLREHAAAAQRFAVANRDGFRKILKKFDRRSGARPLSVHILPQLAVRGFARDADSAPHQGRLAELREQLTRAFHLPPEGPRPAPSPGLIAAPLRTSPACSAASISARQALQVATESAG